jgi:large subunit ribosomal protein L4
VLFVLPIKNKNIYLSARNLKNVEVLTVSELNTYNILNASKIVFTKSAIEAVTKILA